MLAAGRLRSTAIPMLLLNARRLNLATTSCCAACRYLSCSALAPHVRGLRIHHFRVREKPSLRRKSNVTGVKRNDDVGRREVVGVVVTSGVEVVEMLISIVIAT